MQKIILKTPAKINWTLDIIRKREDGYHDIESIMQSIAIYDEIEIKKSMKPGIDVKVDRPDIPGGKQNIAYKVANLMLNTFNIDEGIDIYIHKNIPAAAGMGGGSSDGAAVMLGLKHMYGIDLPLQELISLGSEIGADIPFCMVGGTALAEGIGDKLTQLPSVAKVWLVIVKPKFNISTAKIYELVNIENITRRPDNKKFIHALYERDFSCVLESGANVLEDISARLYPELYNIKQKFRDEGALYTMMSGSGPSIFGVFENREEASSAYTTLKRHYKEIFLTYTIDTGPKVWEVSDDR